jgi:hypothetical protein
MILKILGAESLGARGLCCVVELRDRKILIDPGIALGWSRHGLSPHPVQISVGAALRNRIIRELDSATDVVFSHFHGDHCPLLDPNPYQLGLAETAERLAACRIFSKGPEDISPVQARRRADIAAAVGRSVHEGELPAFEGRREGPLEFSPPLPHGLPGKNRNTLMMTRIEEDGFVFVHASDIQLLDREAVEILLAWKPDIVLASGPPLYHLADRFSQSKKDRVKSEEPEELRELAWSNAARLAASVDTLILDHHLLRSEEGIAWLNKLKEVTGRNVLCAAEYMGRRPLLLEARREELYARYDWPGLSSGGFGDTRTGWNNLSFPV